MSKDKSKTQNAKPSIPVAAPIKVAPLFRPIDWIAFGITALIIFAVYFWTLAPDVTLEDSGELVTGSFYAGIPHPPGYPFWAIYSWLWTVILSFGSVAWRVEVGEAFGEAIGCGIVAFMVSRGSSMLIEGIEALKGISSQWEKAICMVSGFVVGMLLGLDGFMWSEADVINRISVFAVPWLLLVLLCLMRWFYAPQQKRYLYLAALFYGICATIHQTMLLSAMGIEVAIAAAQPRLGRDFFLGNTIIYLVCLIALATKAIPAINNMTSIEIGLFHFVGLGSIAAWNWFYFKSFAEIKKLKNGWLRFLEYSTLGIVGWFLLFFIVIAITKPSPDAAPDSFLVTLSNHIFDIGGKISEVVIWIYAAILSICSIVAVWIGIETRQFARELLTVIGMGFLWVLGVSFYLYEPISCMTDPPMQWGYPRTVEGFFHALSRGQYENIQGTDIFHNPIGFLNQLWYIGHGLNESFGWLLVFVGLLPFLFLRKMQKRERAWIIGLTAIYFCLAVILVILINVTMDKSQRDLDRVFFTASHALFAIMIGYGLTLMAAYMATHYGKFRRWGLLGGIIAVVVALFCLKEATERLFFGAAGDLGFFDLPHWIKQAFDKDQYGLPVFANLILVAIPIIFILALLFYRKRGPVLILLGLFLVMPVYSGMLHWYNSEQRNHWFGYWFGHDMFTPPFGVYPEMTHNAILFGGTDPGRFVPTYMIFCESLVPARCKPMDPKFNRRDVYLITQNALADGTYLDYLRAQYFRSQQHDPPFFSRLFRYSAVTIGLGSRADVDMDLNSEDAGKGNSGDALVEGIASLLDTILDKPLTKFGANVEKHRRAEGVYPPKEIYIPSPEDSQDCFRQYMEDAARRKQLNELQLGEDVNIEPGGQVQVSGQVSVMMINGLLCKVIFDHNPTNDFFVEESFPLQWMYPYETPFGIIMKINRHPLPELTDDIFKKDHEFWSKYSQRLIGNWITYDTSVQQIADFADKVYLQNNYSGFKGDPKFIRDEDAQKSFSKLRSSQAGVYAWRLSPQCPPEYRQKTEAATQALIRETDFAFKQSFAFCPYSPEAVYQYVQFLMQYNRLDDALIVAQTCFKLDPYNTQIAGLVDQLEGYKKQSAERGQIENQLQQMENEAHNNPTNFQNIFKLAQLYFQMQQTNRVNQLFDQALAETNIPPSAIGVIAQFYAQTGNLPKLEGTLEKLARTIPNEPEPWYDLAALKAVVGKKDEALQDLRTSLNLNAARLKTNSAARNLLVEARKDQRFDSLTNLPDFQKIVPQK